LAPTVRFGLTLSNRGIMTGASSLEDMFGLVAEAEASPVWDSVWVGDSVLAKPRVDSVCMLSAIAARTQRLRLGVACFASTPLRHPVLLAYQWSSLDLLSGGRSIFVACMGTGGPGGGDFFKEFEVFGIRPGDRADRMEDAINILRQASLGPVTYHSEFINLDGLAIEPRASQSPLPIWVTSNPDLAKPANVERGLRRVARLGDGWMVGSNTAEDVAYLSGRLDSYLVEHRGQVPPEFVKSLYYNVALDPDPARARDEAARFLGPYYGEEFMEAELRRNVAYGDAEACQAHLRRYIDAGINYVLLRLTSYDQLGQFRAVTEEVVGPLTAELGAARGPGGHSPGGHSPVPVDAGGGAP
jgi:alkanesulfonate monooxygenase SsuD/methylene tetrahydromethanopterin reductase-like flavin-dependent oxidoreductase (luciferase family)